jgi:hypothetical protein
VEGGGRNEAIRRIPVLNYGAASENNIAGSDPQTRPSQSLKEMGKILNGWDIIRKPKTSTFMKKGHLLKRYVGDGELGVLPAFFKGCGNTFAEP